MQLENIKPIWQDDTGFGTLEMVLIIVVLIGLVLVFKEQITNLVGTIFERINSGAASIYS